MSAEVSLGWNNSKLQAGAKGAGAIVDAAANRMKKALGGISQGIGAGIGLGGFNSLTSVVGNAANAMYDATLSADSLRLGMETLTGSEEAAKERLAELQQLAKEPGLGFEQAEEGDIRLQSVGLSADISTRAIREMGNALAAVGKGKADMDGVLLAFTQIASKGKISAEEINQISERVPQVRAVMQDVFGTADTEALQKMGISAEDFIRRLVEGFEKKVPRAILGMQAKLDNFSDAMTARLADVGGALLEKLLGPLESVTSKLDGASEKAKAFGEGLASIAETSIGAWAAVSQAVEEGIRVNERALEVEGALWRALQDKAGINLSIEGELKDITMAEAERTIALQTAAKAERDEIELLKWENRMMEDLTKSYDRAAAAKKRKAEADREAAAVQADKLSGLQAQLDAAEYDALKEKLSLLEQQAYLEGVLLDIEEKMKAVKGKKGSEEDTLKLRIQAKETEAQIERLKKSVDAADTKSGKVTTKDDAKQREYDIARGMYDMELAIAEAAAAGQDKKLAKLEREKAIVEETARIADAMSIGYDEALQKATKLVDTQKRAEDRANGGDGGRRKIQGYSQAQMGGESDARLRAQYRVDTSRQNAADRNSAKFGSFESIDNAQKDKFSRLFGTAPAENAPGKPGGGMDDIKSTFSDVGKTLLELTETLKEGFK